MNNAHNLNLLIRGQRAELVRDALLDVLRGILISGDTVEAGEDEAAERTILVTRFAEGPWLTLFDDGGPEELQWLALEISGRIGSPIVQLLVHDGQTQGLALYQLGQCVEKVGWDLFEKSAPAIEIDARKWQCVLGSGLGGGDVEAAIERGAMESSPLNPLSDLLGLKTQRFVEIDDIDEEEQPDLVRLRLTSARKRNQKRSGGKSKKVVRPSIPEPPAEAKAIPRLLIGRPAEVKRRLKSIVKRVIADGDWSAALAGVEHILIDDVSTTMLTQPPNSFESDDPLCQDRVLLYMVDELLCDLCESREIRTELLLKGMDRPWFCLAVIASRGLPPSHVLPPRQRHDVALAALKKVLRWWPDLCRWGPMIEHSQSKHVRDWETWNIPILRWCEDLGHDWEREVNPLREMDSAEALNRIIDWMAAAQRTSKP